MKALIRIALGVLVSGVGAAEAGPATWQSIGPERGHVVDASIQDGVLLVATRVGVMRAESSDGEWQRDPRFPEGVRRLAGWREGAWAAPPGQLWEVTDTETRFVYSFKGGIAVDLAVLDSGRSIAAVRSPSGGSLWTTDPGQSPRKVLEKIDPWTLCTYENEVWLGTVDKGLWYSDDSAQHFEKIQDGAVTALGRVDNETWAAFSDGRIVSVDGNREILRIEGGHASSIAGLGADQALVTVISPMGQTGPLQEIKDGVIHAIQKLKVDEDIGYLGPTGTWSLSNGQALVGTFRRGPLVWDGKDLSLARKNFRAFVSGGAAIDAQGRLLMAGMGTGVYTYAAGKLSPHTAGEGPVTDTVAIRRLGDQVSVVDFEGIVRLDADGRWQREEGVQDVQRSQRNGLIDIGQDGDDTLWGIDGDKRLHKRVGDTWQRCTIQQALRLDGDGPHLVVATKQGFLKPDCKQAISAFAVQTSAENARALGGWLATPGQLFGGGRLKARLPPGEINALALGKKGLLVAVANQPLLLCSPECVEVSPAPPSPLGAIGFQPDGTIWAMEKKGTMLVLDKTGEQLSPGPWTNIATEEASDWSLMAYLKDPWMSHGPGKGPQGHRKKQPKPQPLGQNPLLKEETPNGSRPQPVASSGLIKTLRNFLLCGLSGLGLFFIWKRKNR
jgi:hypothetical protein